jgi:hypothetical protein
MSNMTKQALAAILAAQKARWAKIKAAKVPTLTAVEIVSGAKFPAVTLKAGNDAATAKQLKKLFADAQTGLRRIVALGLFAWEIKETKLNHGQWGPWLADNCPELSTIDAATQKPVASRALRGHMELTKNVLEACGCDSIDKYLATVAKLANDANLKPGQFLLMPEKKVPENLSEMREKICALVDGKTQRSLFSEFKQLDEATGKPKLGRRKGEGGATKEQRASAEEKERQEQITERKLKAVEIAEWLLEMSDAAGLGEILGTPEIEQLDKAMETARGFIKHGGAK